MEFPRFWPMSLRGMHNVELKHIQMTNDNSDDDDGVAAIRQAIQSSSNNNDVIVWMETPSNPKCQVIDIRAVSDRPIQGQRKLPAICGSTASKFLCESKRKHHASFTHKVDIWDRPDNRF
jgi:O-acetylhomoserine/O-acetylserine sulfhydrylase-like pyridoxal-dependent enzyme